MEKKTIRKGIVHYSSEMKRTFPIHIIKYLAGKWLWLETRERDALNL